MRASGFHQFDQVFAQASDAVRHAVLQCDPALLIKYLDGGLFHAFNVKQFRGGQTTRERDHAGLRGDFEDLAHKTGFDVVHAFCERVVRRWLVAV